VHSSSDCDPWHSSNEHPLLPLVGRAMSVRSFVRLVAKEMQATARPVTWTTWAPVAPIPSLEMPFCGEGSKRKSNRPK
jgi:hypothetical protein